MKRALPELESREWVQGSFGELTQHLAENHHQFLNSVMQRSADELAKLCTGEASPALLEVRKQFRTLTEIVIPHIEEEERVLFPFLRSIEYALKRNEANPLPDGSTLERAIRRLSQQHEAITSRLGLLVEAREAALRSLSARGRIVIDQLNEIERNLREYMDLENNVLFPRALAVEASFAGKPPSKQEVNP